MSLPLIWFSMAGVLMIAEILTGTFYLLSLALGALAGGIVAFVSGVLSVDIWQLLAFGAISVVAALSLPKYLKVKNHPNADPTDLPVGKEVHVEKVGEDYKVKVYGVETIAICDEELIDGAKVKLVARDGNAIRVKKV